MRDKTCFLAVSSTVILAGCLLMLSIFGEQSMKHFWDSAPDGYYRVQPTYVYMDGIYCPLCKSCPSELHGFWRYDNSSGKIHFEGYPIVERSGWRNPVNWTIQFFVVYLENDTIQEVW